jgi:hypothetical protein
MRKPTDVLRLKFEVDLSHRQIPATEPSKAAVTKYLTRAADVGLGWPWPPVVNEAAAERLLFPTSAACAPQFSASDYATVRRENKRQGVTPHLLWTEYEAIRGEQAYRTSQF